MEKNSEPVVLDVVEVNSYDLIKRLWRFRWWISIFVFICSLITAIYTLVVDEKYLVSCSIIASDTSEETSLYSVQGFAGLSLGGKAATPVEKSIILTLDSETFLETILNDYKDDKRLFDDALEKVAQKGGTPIFIKEMQRYVGLEILRKEVINHSMNSDYNTMSISVKLKDKYFAKEFLDDLLKRLKEYIVKQNVSNIKDDIEYYKDMITKIDNVVIKTKLEKKLFSKLEQRFVLSSNIFSIITKPSVPAKRIYPARTITVLLSGMISTFFAFFIVSILPLVRKVISVIRD